MQTSRDLVIRKKMKEMKQAPKRFNSMSDSKKSITSAKNKPPKTLERKNTITIVDTPKHDTISLKMPLKRKTSSKNPITQLKMADQELIKSDSI